MKYLIYFVLLTFSAFQSRAQESDSTEVAAADVLLVIGPDLFVAAGDTLNYANLDSTLQEKARFESELLSKKHYNQAVEIFTSQPDSALKLLDQSSAYDSTFALPYLNKGNIWFSEEKKVQAREAFKKALQLDEALAGAYLGLARMIQQDGNHAETIEMLTKALKFEPTHPQCRYYRGVSFFATKEYEKAAADFKVATEKDPKMATAFNDFGSALMKLGKTEEALAAYNKALSLEPEMAFCYNNRGSLQLQMNKLNQAIDDYSKAITHKPDYALAYNNRGNAYFKAEKFEEAVHDFDKAIELQPDYAFALNNRASAYFKLKAYKEALADLNQAILINPDYAFAYLNRGNVKEMLRDLKGACEDWNKAADMGVETAKQYLSQCDDPFLLGN